MKSQAQLDQEIADFLSSAKVPQFKISSIDPTTMTAGQINKELDKLDAQDSQLGQLMLMLMIDSERGYERPSDYRDKTDALSVELRRLADRRMALHIERDLRYGPGAPPRLPLGRGFGPRKPSTRKRSHSKRGASAGALPPTARRVAYRLKLSSSEMKAVEFARGRYEWPDMLADHAAEDGSIAFTESEMWSWVDDVDSDDSPFPLASPALAAKLQDFRDSVV